MGRASVASGSSVNPDASLVGHFFVQLIKLPKAEQSALWGGGGVVYLYRNGDPEK